MTIKTISTSLRATALLILAVTTVSNVHAVGESPSQPRLLTIGGPGVELSLSRGDSAWFRARFTPSKDYSHFGIETLGDNDTCLSLFRDLTSALANEPLATDDDSGAGLNGKITYLFGYPSPLFVKLEMCGRARSGKVRVTTTRLFQEPAKCDSGGCVLSASLQAKPKAGELLSVLRRTRDLLELSPNGRRLSALYWKISGELLDDVASDPEFRADLSARVARFLPALRVVIGGNGEDIELSDDLVREMEDLKTVIEGRLSPAIVADLNEQFGSFYFHQYVGTPLRELLRNFGLLGSAPDQRSTIIVKMASDTSSGIELRRGRAWFGITTLDAIFQRYPVSDIAPVFPSAEKASGLQRVYKITMEGEDKLEPLLRKLQSNKSIEYAEVDGEMFALSDDVYFQFQYGLMPRSSVAGGIDAVTAWNRSTGNPSLLVAVVDTGVDYNHADLRGRVRRDLGYDYADGDSDPMDDHGHGSHVAGVIASSINNSFGIAGIAPQVTIVPFRALGANGNGSWSSVASGIEAAARIGARLINLSLGADEDSQVVEDALRFAHERGVLTVAAAGNDSEAKLIYPARSRYTIAVAATDRKGKLANFSNSGEGLDLAAPGVDVVSAWKSGDLCYASGTSMATPHVVGVAALVLSRRPTLTNDELSRVLTNTARDAGSPGYDTRFGWGIVDAARAVAN